MIAGGHTIQDNEPKYGLVVLGWADPNHVLSKGGLLPGDVLYLTKPLGTGVITSAIKGDLIEESAATAVIDWMKRLNREAARLAVNNRAKSATDITFLTIVIFCESACRFPTRNMAKRIGLETPDKAANLQ